MKNTPYFLIHKDTFDNSANELNYAIKNYWPNTKVGYSVKSNSMPWVLQYMKKQGFYAEVVSDDEYSLAEANGFICNNIIYNGIAKEKESFQKHIKSGGIVNIDSWREIEWIRELPDEIEKKIGIRVNFDLESMCPGITAAGMEGSRFGISYENGDLKKAVEKIKEIPNASIVGIHLHNSIPSRALEAYAAISKKACEIATTLNLTLEYVDIGGGFFGGLENRPGYKDYFEVIAGELSKGFNEKETTLIVEPGMSILAAAIDYVTSVVDIKETIYNRFVVTDGGRTQIDPMFRKTSHFYEIEAENYQNRKVCDKQVIVGFTCVEGDRLFELYDKPELLEGDKIIYHKVGAYTYTSSSNFIKFQPPIYVENNNNIELVCEKWRAQDFMRKQNINFRN